MRRILQNFSLSTIGLAFLLAGNILVSGCAKDGPQITPQPRVTETPVEEEGSTQLDTNEGDTSKTGQQDIIVTDYQACLNECQAECAKEGGAADVCTSDCSTLSITEGGCKDDILINDGDPLTIPPGMKFKTVKLSHCTWGTDALSINQGVMSFVTQREIGYRSGFAAAGNGASATAGTRQKATVVIEDKTYEWKRPGVLPFSLASKVENIDLSKPTKFERVSVTLHGNSDERGVKSAQWLNYANYWGHGVDQAVMLYSRRPYWRSGGIFGFFSRTRITNCDFTTEFKFHYYEQATAQ